MAQVGRRNAPWPEPDRAILLTVLAANVLTTARYAVGRGPSLHPAPGGIPSPRTPSGVAAMCETTHQASFKPV
ncbi:hypothetical protein [Streptomyces sp. OE57]|uniref:hypothetical protein n=1 Tax=Streptomyces lacaronensis TaxID=3379885 RepID=UPI0039B77CBC